MADTQDIDVDNIIEQLLTVRGSRPGRQVNLTEGEIRWLCIKSREIFTVQPVLLELEAPIKICGAFDGQPRQRARSAVPSSPYHAFFSPHVFCPPGDIHGQYYDLLRLFEYGGFPPTANYLFLGCVTPLQPLTPCARRRSPPPHGRRPPSFHTLQRLRRQREAIARDHLSAVGLQNQVPGELLHPPREPRVRFHQQNLRLLRRMYVAWRALGLLNRCTCMLLGLVLWD